MSTDLAQLAADRYEIADALHRFAFGLDHGDADSLASALAEDVAGVSYMAMLIWYMIAFCSTLS
jgi:hypothetical protein